MLERIKHLFDVEGVAFILLVNRAQIESYIRTVYGEVDAKAYLLKFGSLFIDLPNRPREDRHENGRGEYCHRLASHYSFPDQTVNSDFLANSMAVFANHFELTLREIQKAITTTAIYYRFQFERLLETNLWEFSRSDWAICRSPLDLPMSDVGLVSLHLENLNANHHLLPLGPRLLLEGVFYHDQTKNSVKTTIRGFRMTPDEAQYRIDCICFSSLREIIFSRRTPDIEVVLVRAA